MPRCAKFAQNTSAAKCFWKQDWASRRIAGMERGKYAQMMELVDMLDSKSGVRKDVGVQVPLWVVI